MRTIANNLSVFLFWALASPAMAGITVTSYTTTALTNGFSPVGSGQYYAEQVVPNTSPATAEVFGDWMGPNADGTPDTWHYVGSAQANSTSVFDANTYTVTAGGSFGYELNTTLSFVDPRSSSIYGPGAAANYRGFFETDVACAYSVHVKLNQHSSVSLGSFETGFVFNYFNANPSPLLIDIAGTIPAGHYQVLVTTGLGAPNFPNGINHFNASGSYQNFNFTVQVPEPNSFAGVLAIMVTTLYRHKRPYVADVSVPSLLHARGFLPGWPALGAVNYLPEIVFTRGG